MSVGWSILLINTREPRPFSSSPVYMCLCSLYLYINICENCAHIYMYVSVWVGLVCVDIRWKSTMEFSLPPIIHPRADGADAACNVCIRVRPDVQCNVPSTNKRRTPIDSFPHVWEHHRDVVSSPPYHRAIKQILKCMTAKKHHIPS